MSAELTSSGSKNLIIHQLKAIPEALVWRANMRSKRSIETYDIAIRQFVDFVGIKSHDDFQTITHAHVIAFRNKLEDDGKKPATINNRLSALSSLFDHLIEQQLMKHNPTRGVRRMPQQYRHVKSKRLTSDQARAILDSVDLDTPLGYRNRAVLATLLYIGCRISEVCRLTVSDYFEENGYHILDFQTKGNYRNRIAIHPEARQCIDEYLAQSGHGGDKDAPLFVSTRRNHYSDSTVKHMSRQMADNIWKKAMKSLGLEGFSPHSARTTFISVALENNCPIDVVQTSVGHSQIKTTQMYDKREKNFKDSASFSVRY